MEYNDTIKHLEEHCSYGTLGRLNTLVSQSSMHIKWDLFYINVTTLVRDNLHKDLSDDVIINKVIEDIQYLKRYINQYANPGGMVVFYIQSTTFMRIPKSLRKKETDPRMRVGSIIEKILKTEGYSPDSLIPQEQLSNVNVFIYANEAVPTHSSLDKLSSYQLKKYRNPVLMSHVSMDFLSFRRINNLQVLEGHTGRVFGKDGLSKKVFKDESIPFNHVTLKAFGDKDYVRPLIRNKKKAMKLLEGINLHTKTERQLVKIFVEKLALNKDELNFPI